MNGETAGYTELRLGKKKENRKTKKEIKKGKTITKRWRTQIKAIQKDKKSNKQKGEEIPDGRKETEGKRGGANNSSSKL